MMHVTCWNIKYFENRLDVQIITSKQTQGKYVDTGDAGTTLLQFIIMSWPGLGMSHSGMGMAHANAEHL